MMTKIVETETEEIVGIEIETMIETVGIGIETTGETEIGETTETEIVGIETEMIETTEEGETIEIVVGMMMIGEDQH